MPPADVLPALPVQKAPLVQRYAAFYEEWEQMVRAPPVAITLVEVLKQPADSAVSMPAVSAGLGPVERGRAAPLPPAALGD